MLLSKQLQRMCIQFQRKYCVSKNRPPGAHESWTPYDQILHGKESDYVEDVMEFKGGGDEKQPFQRSKGGQSFWFRYLEKCNRAINNDRTFIQKFRTEQRARLIADQIYDPVQVKALGPDLAAAYFLCNRGCGVKFVGKSGFVQPGINKAYLVLPQGRDDDFKVEAINAVNYNLLHQGLTILSELESLRWISFKGNTDFDNWCMDKLSLVAPKLEFINLSGCRKIDHDAFACLYRFKNLRCVSVEDTNQTDIFKLTCLTLEHEHPNLVFLGLILKKPRKSVFSSDV